MSVDHVGISFWVAFVMDMFIVLYAFRLSKRMGNKGLLAKVTLYAGLSALVFGLHHILEIFLEHLSYGIAFAEGVEAVAAILLLLSVYKLYKLTEE